MLCPKCKNEISDTSLKCEYCGTKVGSYCKDCGTYNLITAITCSNCNKKLIRICSECGAANLPDSGRCRKCGIEFLSDETETELMQPMYFANMDSQQRAKSKLKEGIKNSDTRIITLSGESGCGKSLVLRYTIGELKNAKIVWLLGSCTQTTQLSPFGYFQDVLLNFFNINNFCPDTLQLKKNSLKFFKQDFPTLTNNEILDLLNFLYPEQTDKYENIYYNKAKMFIIMKKVILTILEKTKVVFIIDNFEYIDGMSYDFIHELLKEDIILEKSKFIITSNNPKPGLGLITSKKLKDNNYLDIAIAPFTPSQVETFLKQYKDFNFGKDFTNLCIKISGGNPAILEQIVLLHNDIKRNNLKDLSYNSIESAMEYRLKILNSENVDAYRLLVAFSVLGVKFCPAMLDRFDNHSPQEIEQLVELLINRGFITQINNLGFEFKSSIIWKSIVNTVKNDSCFENILNILYDILTMYRQSSIALVGYIVQKLNNNDNAFDIWTILMKQASYVGDIGLYIISQKQCLKLIENKNGDFYQKVKKNIYTRVGKLLEPINHKEAFEYLQQAVLMLNDDEDSNHVELLGYIASCSMKAGNFYGAIECINNAMSKIPDEMSFEKILMKTRLVSPLLKLGNYGELINTVENEILPELEKYITKGRDTQAIKIKDLFDTWLRVYTDYAEALVFQGNNRAFEVIQTLYEIIENNEVTDQNIICSVNLLLALANTVKGDFKNSNKILDDILKDYSLDNMNSFVVSRWNFIDILNKFFEKKYNDLQQELFNVAAYANNTNDNFTKNILKTLLAKMLKDNSQTKKALEILEEQVAYFAKEKVAAGVLLSWYLIAKIKLVTSGTQFALDIATKALDIANGPNINNYYFIALFNKLIGEIYLAKQDFESSKVYLEKAIFIAKQFDLQFILMKTYLLCARLYQELALPKSASRGSYIKQALKMFQLAKNVPIVTEQKTMHKIIKEQLGILTSFCKLNGIVLKKESK